MKLGKKNDQDKKPIYEMMEDRDNVPEDAN
jgi:hypothetical protein